MLLCDTLQRALLRTAQEIAKGMEYMLSFGIIQGDLKLGNVLLKTHRVDRRGYVAKVSDFGEFLLAVGVAAVSCAGVMHEAAWLIWQLQQGDLRASVNACLQLPSGC